MAVAGNLTLLTQKLHASFHWLPKSQSNSDPCSLTKPGKVVVKRLRSQTIVVRKAMVVNNMVRKHGNTNHKTTVHAVETNYVGWVGVAVNYTSL